MVLCLLNELRRKLAYADVSVLWRSGQCSQLENQRIFGNCEEKNVGTVFKFELKVNCYENRELRSFFETFEK